MMIQENLKRIVATIPEGVTLLAVSKTKPESDILEAYEFGIRDFGENKVQEMTRKYEALPKDIRWHLIGHLQTNKVKYIAPYVHLVHSVDSLRLLEEINKEAKKCNRVISCLLQFHTASEETKFGLLQEEAVQILESESYKQMENVRICGVMGMATNTDDTDLIHREFKTLKSIFDFLKTNYFSDSQCFGTISMGMSEDYKIAIEEGSTIVRIGSSIFGERDYSKLA
ncbi:MAG: YggS family pyridoxal phosphate-dependent enzyme [Bacteroidales bacterium]|nr:YggS family pyridoxal phosphate-dependent enzyme [Bacteroidales bacterium]